MATHPFARRQWLGFSALGCVLGASAASGIGTFANFSPCAGFWRQKSVSQWAPRWRGMDSNLRSRFNKERPLRGPRGRTLALARGPALHPHGVPALPFPWPLQVSTS
jgi:hypothetical protein